MSKPITMANGFTLALAQDGERFLGIGEVTFQGTPLRSPALPWTVYTESEHGFRFDEFRLQGVETDGDAVTIVFTSEGSWLPRLQDADAMGDARVVSRRLHPPVATFRWHFRPITEQIYEQTYTGLAMSLEVNTPGNPIHWIIEDTTWELGGAAAGCTLIQQDVSVIDLEQTVQADSVFSTIERFFTEETGACGGCFPMDMLPRAAGAAICDFQVKDDLAMVIFVERPSLLRARLDKFADENVIHYTDRPFFNLTEQLKTNERKLLVYRHPSPLARHEWRNLWLDCFSEVRRRILAVYDFQLEIPLPTVSAHLWDDDLRAYGPAWTKPLEDVMPLYKQLGYSEVFTHGVWESCTSDPEHMKDGNICCPYANRYAEAFGGNAGMKHLISTARDNGIKIYQWFGMQYSIWSPVWKEHPDWILHEANGDPWDANYKVLQAGRMHSGFGDHLLQEILQVRIDTGLDNAFWDSYQNLGVTCVDWQSPDKAPQAEEIWHMQSEMQKAGYKQRCEVVTIFGVSQVAMYGFENDMFRRRLWSDTVKNDDAFALLDCSPCFFTEGTPFTADKLDPVQYFWLCGYRAVPIIDARPWGNPIDPEHGGPRTPGGELAEGYAQVNHLYNAVLPHMVRLRTTADGLYALWLDSSNQPAVIWAFHDASMPYTGDVLEVASGTKSVATGTLALAAGKAYLLGDHAPANK